MKKILFLSGALAGSAIIALVFMEVVFNTSFGANIVKYIHNPLRKDDGSFKIYVVGESTSEGEPYIPKISFAKIVSYMFGGKLRNREIRIINLAKGGKNAEYEYWRLLGELYLRPPGDGLLLIYSGINDACQDSYDEEYGRWRFLQNSLVISKIQYLLQETNINWLRNIFGVNNPRSLQRYDYRLRKIVKLAERFKLKVIISTLVSNYADFSPLKEGSEFADDIKLAQNYRDRGDFRKARGIYSALLLKSASNRDFLNFSIAQCYQATGDYGNAKEYFYHAVDSGNEIRPTLGQDRVIRKIASEYGIPLADNLRYFEENSPNGLLGNSLFHDAHHPNLKGHILLAKGFAREMEKLYGVKTVRPDPGTEEVESYFGLTEQDKYVIYASKIFWLVFLIDHLFMADDKLRSIDECLLRVNEMYAKDPNKGDRDFYEVANFGAAIAHKDLKKAALFANGRNSFYTSFKNFKNTVILILKSMNAPEEVFKKLEIDGGGGA